VPFDGLVMAAVRSELEAKLTGGRIERVYQPDKVELVLLVHKPGARQKLLLSANARNARVHLTKSTRENPTSPPLFCMVLRKHLEGGRIIGFEQAGLERVLVVRVDSRDELGQPSEKHLICEIMGKHSNIILKDNSNGVVIDGIKRYSHSVSRYREILPGRQYLSPPSQHKLNPLTLDEDKFRQACLALPLETKLPELLQKSFDGLSIVTCREIVSRAGLQADDLLDHCGDHELRSLWKAFYGVLAPANQGQFTPCIITGKRGEPLEFAALDLHHTGQKSEGGEMNSLLDVFFSSRETMEKLDREKNSVSSLLNKEIARLEKKLNLYAGSLEEATGNERLRLYGELLTANLYRLQKGPEEVTLENYFEETCPAVTIPLGPHLTPSENAQVYFKKYVKSKNTRAALEVRTGLALDELDYLEGVKIALDHAAVLQDLAEVKQELADQGYIKQSTLKHKKDKKAVPAHQHFTYRSTDGFQILVGKNNKQNDYLTMRMAREEDIWLHAKDIPGAHVIIRSAGKEVPLTTLTEAAGLAAYFSKGRSAGSVPVDYTFKKHVRKPKGAKPGRVIYDHQKTIMAAPDEEAALRTGIETFGGEP